jgi:hypothetical protein
MSKDQRSPLRLHFFVCGPNEQQAATYMDRLIQQVEDSKHRLGRKPRVDVLCAAITIAQSVALGPSGVRRPRSRTRILRSGCLGSKPVTTPERVKLPGRVKVPGVELPGFRPEADDKAPQRDRKAAEALQSWAAWAKNEHIALANAARYLRKARQFLEGH